MGIEMYRSIEIEMNACDINTKKVKFILVGIKFDHFIFRRLCFI